jgi:multiple sugar transport system substrate-binding protein
VDEAGQRTIMVNAVDAVNLKKSDPGEVLKAAAAEEQALIDSFWK